MKNQKAINDMEALIIDNPRLGATKPEMANGEKEVRKYSSGSTNCIEESVLNVKAADTCIPIRDRTHQEITDLPDFFLKSNANTVPLNALNVSDTIHAVEKGLRTKTFLLEGTRTVSMVIDDYEIKSNGTTPASGSIKCIFTQGSSSKEQEKKPTPRENPKTFNEEHGKGSNGGMINEDSGFHGDSWITLPSGESNQKRRIERLKKRRIERLKKWKIERQVKDKGSNGGMINEDSGFQGYSWIPLPSGESNKKRRIERLKKRRIERHKKRKIERQVKDKGSNGVMINEDSGFHGDSWIPLPSGESNQKRRIERLKKRRIERHKKRRIKRQVKNEGAVLLVLHVLQVAYTYVMYVYLLLMIINQLFGCSFAKTPEQRSCHLKFRGELDHEKLFLKCYYGIPCSGTKKWTGGIEGLQLYKGVKKETPNGKIYECVEEKLWFAMIIRNWTDADIFSQYKCWNKFKELSVILNEQPILYKTSDDNPLRCNDENEEMTMLTMNVTVLHTSQHPSFTYVTERENFTQNLMVSQRSEKMGPWFITDIYAEINRENNANDTFYLIYKDNKTFTILEEFVQCNGSKGTLSDLKAKSSTVVVAVVSSICVGVLIALGVFLGCYMKKKPAFCCRHERETSSAATSTSNPNTSFVKEPLMANSGTL